MGTSAPRENKGAWVCAAGVGCNLLLAAGKITLGLLTGLVSVIADGINNVSDCGSGIVALISFFIAKKPADKKHPFGHRRAESVASLIMGCFILFLAAELLRDSIGKMGEGGEATLLVYLILALSIAVKAGMFLLYRIYAKKLDSETLKAAATDSLCDCIATAATIAGTLLSPYLPAADGIAGIAVSLFIAWQGIAILLETSSKLLGQAADPALTETIKKTVLAEKEVLGVHDLQIYTYGKGVAFATIHAEMDERCPMADAHAVVDRLEAQIRAGTGVTLTIHIDPVDLTDREGSVLRLKIQEAAAKEIGELELHDFRLIPGTNQVEFDALVPYSCKKTDEELTEVLEAVVRSLGGYVPLIRIERA